jgi:hypothetical protein
MAVCDPFEPMTFDIDVTCCIAKVLCNGEVKMAFNLGTTTIVETNGGYRINDGISVWSIPSDQAGSYSADIAALWDAICICRSSGTLGEANLDRELVEICYDAIGADTGYSIGDKITRVMILDVTTDPSTIESSIYINKTTGSAITIGDLADLQVCTGSGTCVDPIYVYDYRHPFCLIATHETVYRGIDACTDGSAYYDYFGNFLAGVSDSDVVDGACPVRQLAIFDGITILNDNTEYAQPLPDLNKISFKNDGATDLEISFDNGATWPLKIYSTSGVISFGGEQLRSYAGVLKYKGSVTSKYLVWWES